MRVDVAELGPLARLPDDVVDSLPGQRLAALGNEESGQLVVARCQIPLDGAQLITGDGLLCAERVLHALDPQT